MTKYVAGNINEVHVSFRPADFDGEPPQHVVELYDQNGTVLEFVARRGDPVMLAHGQGLTLRFSKELLGKLINALENIDDLI